MIGDSGSRRMPAEWDRHAATWLQWPCREGASFPGDWTDRIEPFFVELVEVISAYETVKLAVRDRAEENRVKAMLSKRAAAATEFYQIRTLEPWSRDIVPTFVAEGASELVAVNWSFNGWGGQWPHEVDDEAGGEFAKVSGARVLDPGIVLEGGAVETNGSGLLLVAEESVLDPERNPGMTKQRAEEIFGDYLGASKTIWLRGDLQGDDTGHVDVVARFVSENRVVVPRGMAAGTTDDQICADNKARLLAAGLEVMELPLIEPSYSNVTENFLPRSYVNFYVLNGAVLVPSFGVKEDLEAKTRLSEAFPNREVIALDCNDLVFGRGGIHCLTQQLPA